MNKNIEVNDFTKVITNYKLPIITIYENPEDMPGYYVARLFDGSKPTYYYAKRKRLKDLKKTIPHCMINFGRTGNDVSCLLETWI